MIRNTNIIATFRCYNQQLVSHNFSSARQLVAWMGAIQAQDYIMSKWAFGIRLKDLTESAIEREINGGSIIRTHVLRPTWHFVSSDDISWMLSLTAPRIKSSLKSREKQLEITNTIINRSNRLLEKSLRDDNHLTRAELISEFRSQGINTEDNRASHLFIRAELDGIICSGRQRKGKPTYALLNEWVPDNKKFNREDALRELARRYFTSHGPATVYDFSWWSGLTLGDVRSAIDFNKDLLRSELINEQTYWMADPSPNLKSHSEGILFLPPYDEFLISYRDRTASLELADNKKAVSSNGIFYPTIIKNGQVIGTWKRSISKTGVTITKDLFKSFRNLPEKDFSNCITHYLHFLRRHTD